MEQEHAKLFFHPKIWFHAERVAEVLGISIEKADQLLSSPDTPMILQKALDEGINHAFNQITREMARMRWPQERVPVRIDCNVDLPSPPAASAKFGPF